jgi:hypothetical protein
MDMAAVLDEMMPGSHGSPDVREKSVPEEPPDVQAQRRANKRPRAARCIAKDFGKPPSRSPSPPPEIMLSPRALRPVKLPGLDKEDKGKGPAEEMETGRASPRKILRLQMQRKRQATMNGGSSAHNVQKPVKLQRCESMYLPSSLTDMPEVDPETAARLAAAAAERAIVSITAFSRAAAAAAATAVAAAAVAAAALSAL